jgi:hypothetical protein
MGENNFFNGRNILTIGENFVTMGENSHFFGKWEGSGGEKCFGIWLNKKEMLIKFFIKQPDF